MYVKVHNKGNYWFRDDNGTIVGETVTTNSYYRKVQHLIKTMDKRYILAMLGYLNDFDDFVPLCLGPSCYPPKCQMRYSDICYHSHSQRDSFGYYIISD